MVTERFLTHFGVFFFQVDNRTLVCRTFQRGLVQNHELTRPQSETLVLFLMDYHAELFKVLLGISVLLKLLVL